jgi:hypothetical protein
MCQHHLLIVISRQHVIVIVVVMNNETNVAMLNALLVSLILWRKLARKSRPPSCKDKRTQNGKKLALTTCPQ